MKKTVLVLIGLVLFIPVVAFGTEGQPFKALQDQIDQLKMQLQNIQLTPGPPGQQDQRAQPGQLAQRVQQGQPEQLDQREQQALKGQRAQQARLRSIR